MKKLLCISILIILFSSCSRVQRIEDGESVIRKVFKVELSKEEIFSRAQAWMTKKFTKENESIRINDKSKGKVVARGFYHYYEYFNLIVKRPFSFLMTVEARENRYRVSFSDFFIHYEERTNPSVHVKYKQQLDNIKGKVRKYNEDLLKFMESKTIEKSPVKKDDDW